MFIFLQLHAELEKYGLPDLKLYWIQIDRQISDKEQKEGSRKNEQGIPSSFFLNRRDILCGLVTLIKDLKQ